MRDREVICHTVYFGFLCQFFGLCCSVSTLLQSAHIAVLFIVIDLPGFFPQLLVPRAQNMDAHPKKCAIDTKK